MSLNNFSYKTISTFSIVDFEQVNISWEDSGLSCSRYHYMKVILK